jgi:PAS domain S-box-containing protein
MSQPQIDTETLQRLLDQAPGYIFFTDLDLNIQYVNRMSHGFELEKVVGKSCVDFLGGPEQQGQKVSAAFQSARDTGAPQVAETVVETPDGGRLWLSTQISLVRDESDTAAGFIAVSTDMSEQREAELALEGVRTELLEASHRAGMSEVAMGVLNSIGSVLSNVSAAAHVADDHLKKSHHFQLGEALGKLSLPPPELSRFLREEEQGVQFPLLLRRIADELRDEREKLLSEVTRVKQQVELMQATIAAQQAFAKAELVVQEIQLGYLIERVASIFRIDLEERRIELKKDVRPALVTLDTQSTLQILANQVRNAIEAMEGPGEPRRLTLSAGVKDGRVIIEVEDTGSGIEQAVQARMFQHGFTTKPKGHGFGLHAAATAAQAMSGTLTAHSDGPGFGARFRLDLPDRRSADGEQCSA